MLLAVSLIFFFIVGDQIHHAGERERTSTCDSFSGSCEETQLESSKSDKSSPFVRGILYANVGIRKSQAGSP